MKHDAENREGFWKSSERSDLPQPRAAVDPWFGREHFLAKLKEKEASLVPILFRGWTMCRICTSVSLGNAEYQSDNWAWPGGYSHYVQEHGVRPSLAFEEHIIGERVR
jgi:hypothetical protein